MENLEISGMNNIDYDEDYYGWVVQQVDHLKNSEFDRLDIEHLIDEVLSLARNEIDKIENFIETIFMNMLKIKYQPHMHTKSWDLSIKISSHKTKDILEDNPSLKPHLREIINDSYESARLEAAKETGLNEEIFPEECPWTVRDVFPEIEDRYI
jgi:mannitol-1-phosphate/altronate dehydrogenase